jgi:hypothetical protein
LKSNVAAVAVIEAESSGRERIATGHVCAMWQTHRRSWSSHRRSWRWRMCSDAARLTCCDVHLMIPTCCGRLRVRGIPG